MAMKLTTVFILLAISCTGYAYPSQSPQDSRFNFAPAGPGSPFWGFYLVPAEVFQSQQAQAAQPNYLYTPESMSIRKRTDGNGPDFDGLWATRG